MANAQSVRAGRAHVEIGTQNNPLIAGLKAASLRVQSWAKGCQEVLKKAFIGGLAVTGLLAKGFGDFSALTPKLGLLRDSIRSALAPAFAVLTEKLGTAIDFTAAWVRQNPGMIQLAAKLALGFTAAAGAAFLLSKSVIALGYACKTFSAIGTIVTGTLSLLFSTATMLLSPLGLIAAAVAGISVAFFTLTDTGKAMTASLSTSFANMGDTFKTTWAGVIDALRAGNFELAFRVVMAGAKLAWVQGIEGLKDVWAKFVDGFTNAKEGASTAIAIWFVNAGTAIKRSWSHTIAYLNSAWEHVIAGMKIAWHTLIEGVSKGWAYIKSLLPGGEEYESAAARIDQIAAARNAGTRQARDEAIAGHDARLADIDRRQLADNAALVNEIRAQEERAQKARERARQQARDAESAAVQKELDEALANLNAVRAEAADELKRVNEAGAMGQLRLIAAAPGAPPDLEERIQRQSQGTFNAFAARGFGAGEDKLLKVNEETRDFLRRIERKVGMPVFT